MIKGQSQALAATNNGRCQVLPSRVLWFGSIDLIEVIWIMHRAIMDKWTNGHMDIWIYWRRLLISYTLSDQTNAFCVSIHQIWVQISSKYFNMSIHSCLPPTFWRTSCTWWGKHQSNFEPSLFLHLSFLSCWILILIIKYIK